VPAPVAARFQDIPAYFGLTDVLSQPVTDENFAIIERLAHWVAAGRMWESAPWLGVGPGNYNTVYPTVNLPRWDEPLGHAHNIYLNTLAESGLVGFAAYLCLWLVVILWLWRQRRRALQRQAGWTTALIIGIIGVIGHSLVHNFFDNLFVQGIYLQMAFWLALVSGTTTDDGYKNGAGLGSSQTN
jgi:O-antigen ligase